MSAVLDFGKHAGKSLVATVFADPAWYSWAVHRGVFHDRGGPALQIEAERIWINARNIRKPRRYPDDWQVAYYYQGWTHKFVGLSVVADGRCEEYANMKGVLDLGYVTDCGCRDGVGNRLLSRAIKRVLFGEKTKVTAKMLEALFADPSNFDLPSLDRQRNTDTPVAYNPTSASSKMANTCAFRLGPP
jgi:hypothetical protein